jgi:hypothetical protein
MITLLILNIRPELEEDMVDYLLVNEAVSGFTSYLARGHGDHKNMVLSEQVSGRRKRLQFELMVDEVHVAGLLAGLADNVGRDIVYWQQAVSNIGRI